MIDPTIGRVVWYHPKPHQGDPPPLFPELPYVALIAGIQPTGLLNLAIWNHAGFGFQHQGVILRQDDEPVEQGDAEWMPYQKGIAAKSSTDKEPVSRAEHLDAHADTQQAAILILDRLKRLEARVGKPGDPPNDTGSQSQEFRLHALELVAQAGSKLLSPEKTEALQSEIAKIVDAEQASQQAPPA